MTIAILGPCERAGAVALVLMLGCIHAWPCLIVMHSVCRHADTYASPSINCLTAYRCIMPGSGDQVRDGLQSAQHTREL